MYNQLPRRVKDRHTPVHLHWTVQQLHDMDWKYNALVGYININMIHKMDISAQDGHPVRCSYMPFNVPQLQPYICCTIYPIYTVRWTWQKYIRCTAVLLLDIYRLHDQKEEQQVHVTEPIHHQIFGGGGRRWCSCWKHNDTKLSNWQTNNFIEKLLIFEVLSSLWQMTSATLVPPLVSKKPWCIGIYSSTALLAKFKPDKSTQVQMGQVQTTNFSLDLAKR